VRDLPPGWATDLAILEHSGALIEEHPGHLVVRSPSNPGFHWGNCLFVLEETAVDDAGRWLAAFAEAHPQAGWVAIGLPRPPADAAAWTSRGLDLEHDDVLTSPALPRQTPPPDGYRIGALTVAADWEQSMLRALRDNDQTGQEDPAGFEAFARARARSQQDLCQRGLAAWYGAWAPEGDLVADLGIVRCGLDARYQNVGTDAAHRRRGLAGHLLGVAGAWAAGQGCTRWVIVTEADNPAGRVYRAAGFAPGTPNTQAYRRPAR
jgi:GNAT superfamily N-acetyltransferase